MHRYTEDEVAELRKCVNDPIYFMESYCKVSSPVHAPELIELTKAQKNIVMSLDKGNVKQNMGRQSGKTTVGLLYMLWLSIFHSHKTCMFVSVNNALTKHHRQSLQFIYHDLPDWLKPRMLVNNVHTIEFDNGSRIILRPCLEHTGRGMTVSFLFLDELAFGKHSTVMSFWHSIIPTLASTNSSRMLSLSTFNINDIDLSMWITGPLDIELVHGTH